MKFLVPRLVVTARWFAAAVAVSAAPATPVGVVGNITVSSDQAEDVSSVEAWKGAYALPTAASGRCKSLLFEQESST